MDAERAALEKANAALCGAAARRLPSTPSEGSSAYSGSPDRGGHAAPDGPSDAEVEAARLALELAHERSLRAKAERDFEVASLRLGPCYKALLSVVRPFVRALLSCSVALVLPSCQPLPLAWPLRGVRVLLHAAGCGHLCVLRSIYGRAMCMPA